MKRLPTASSRPANGVPAPDDVAAGGGSGASRAGPTPTAVALAYDRGRDRAPRVVAKGRGEVAERIVQTAAAAQVAIEENAALAEALQAVELDHAIPIELYSAVAEVIAFVMRQAKP